MPKMCNKFMRLLFPLALVIYAVYSPIASAQDSAAWKKGDDLGTIKTTNGTTYSSAKLEDVEPDGISILDSDGGAKINFEKLPPYLQKKFGYDPDRGASYAREQALLAQIDRLQQENAALRQRLNLVATEPVQQPQGLKAGPERPTVAGFHAYLYSLQSQGKGMKSVLRNSHSAALVYAAGPLEGMSKDQAISYAQQQWGQLPVNDQMSFEENAKFYGDPIAKQEEQDRAAATRPTSATVYSSDGTVSQVQYH